MAWLQEESSDFEYSDWEDQQPNLPAEARHEQPLEEEPEREEIDRDEAISESDSGTSTARTPGREDEGLCTQCRSAFQLKNTWEWDSDDPRYIHCEISWLEQRLEFVTPKLTSRLKEKRFERAKVNLTDANQWYLGALKQLVNHLRQCQDVIGLDEVSQGPIDTKSTTIPTTSGSEKDDDLGGNESIRGNPSKKFKGPEVDLSEINSN